MRTRTEKGWTLTAGALAAVAMSAMAVTLGGPIADQAEAVAPPVPAGCSAANATSVNGTAGTGALAPIPNADDADPLTPLTYSAGATRTSIITVAGAGTYLRDVDLRTTITHQASKDVTIRLTGPNNKTIVINSGNERDTYDGGALPTPTGFYRNGGPNDDMWNGTRWDDQGGVPVNDFAFTPANEGTPVASIEPEGSLGTFVGINPNGQWKLEVTNAKPNYATNRLIVPPPATGPTFTEDPDTGNFASWGLDLSTYNAGPALTTTTVTNATAGAIPDGQPNGPGITRDFAVVAPPGQTVHDLDLITKIPHGNIADVEMTLTSPAGTQVSIATDPGRGEGDYANTFNPTRWDDGAADGVTDVAFTSGVNKATLQPEEALAAFNGENPNGTWKLNVVDDEAADTGTFETATLDIKSSGCGVSTPPVVPPVVVPPTNNPTPPGTGTNNPPVSTQALTLGLSGKAKRTITLGAKTAKVKINLNKAAKITAVLSRGKKKLRTVTKAGLAGSNTISVKLPKKVGKYTLKVTAAADGKSLAKTITLTIKAKPAA